MAAVKTWIINLERSANRRVHMEQQLADHLSGLEHEFVVAVDGRKLEPTEWAKLVDEEAVARSRWLTPGMIGNALSHRAACQRISAGEHPIGLVLEDDVIFTPTVEQVVTDAADQMTGADVVLVLFYRSPTVSEPCRFTRTDAVRLSDDRDLARPLDPGQLAGSGAYLITREAAKQLADVTLPVRRGTDSWSAIQEAGGFDQIRCVVPPAITNDPEFRSTMGVPERHRGRRGTPVDTLMAAALEAVARYHVPPFHQVMRARRARGLSRYAQYMFVD